MSSLKNKEANRNDVDVDFGIDPYNPDYRPISLRKLEESMDSPQSQADTEELSKRENQGSGQWQNNTDDSNPRPRPKLNLSDVAGIIRNPSSILKLSTMSKAGGSVTLIGIILITFISFMQPLNLMHLASQLKNMFNASPRMASARWDKKVESMLDKKDSVEKACKKPASQLCKNLTITEKNVKVFQGVGIAVNGEKTSNGRIIVKSFVMPGQNTEITSYSQLKTTLQSHPAFATAFKNAIDVRVATGNNSRTVAFLNKIGLKKLPAHALNTDDANVKDRFADLTGQVRPVETTNEDGTPKTDKEIQKETEARDKKVEANVKRFGSTASEKMTKIFKPSKGFNAADSASQLACGTYGSAKAVNNIVMGWNLKKHADLAIFFLHAGESVSFGASDPKTVSTAGDILTGRNKEGKSAMDSQLFLAMLGNKTNTDIQKVKSNVLGDGTLTKVTQGIVTKVDSTVGGANNTRKACNTLNMASTVIGSVMCLSAGPLSAILCAGGTIIVLTQGDKIVEQAGKIIEPIVSNYVIPAILSAAKNYEVTVDSRGPEVMDSVVVGTSYVMDLINRSNGAGIMTQGMTLAADYDMTRESDNFYKQVDIAAARDTPFDIYNKYSVAGSIASTMLNTNNGNIDPSTPILALLKAVNPTNYTPSALAYASQPSSISDEQLSLDNCVLPEHIDQKALCTPAGYTMPAYSQYSSDGKNIANISPIENVEYLTKAGLLNNETGLPASIKNNPINLVEQYCFDEISAISGASELALDDPNYSYSTGEACKATDEKTLHIFTYVLDKKLQEDIDSQGETTTASTGLFSDPSQLKDLPRGVASTIDGHANGKLPNDKLVQISFAPEHKLYKPAAEGLEMLNKQFKADLGYNLPFTDSYRPYEAQVSLKEQKRYLAAEPGTSNHGLGMAIDVGGEGHNNDFGGEIYKWLEENGWKYGWQQPNWARENGSKPESWHWEYGGYSEGIEPKN